jgi:RNA-directed DNA polymerase
VRSKRAGERTMASIQRFIEGKLRLKVNEKKSAIDRPWKRKFLGFSFTFTKEPKVRIAKESVKRMKKKVREITSRKMPYPMEYRIQKLNQYLIGWCGYFALADTKSILSALDGWIRRRLRMCSWKNWKKSKTKIRNLIKLGVPEAKAYEWGNSRKGYWRISKSPVLNKTLDNSY